MSTNNATEFLKSIGDNPSLQKTVSQVLYCRDLAHIARQSGFSFTAEALKVAIQQAKAAAKEDSQYLRLVGGTIIEPEEAYGLSFIPTNILESMD